MIRDILDKYAPEIAGLAGFIVAMVIIMGGIYGASKCV